MHMRMRRELLQQMLNDRVIGTGNAPTGITQHQHTHTADEHTTDTAEF